MGFLTVTLLTAFALFGLLALRASVRHRQNIAPKKWMFMPQAAAIGTKIATPPPA